MFLAVRPVYWPGAFACAFTSVPKPPKSVRARLASVAPTPGIEAVSLRASVISVL